MWTPETLADRLMSPAMARTMAALPSVPATATPTPGSHATAGFGALYGEVRDEVSSFIRQGAIAQDDDTPLLNASGWLLRQQMQAHALGDTTAATASSTSSAASAITSASGNTSADQADFLDSIAPWARQAADRLGVDPDLIAAHAALESGWGRQPLRLPDGRDTNNLFSLKAGARWAGESTQAATTEYEQGMPQARTERFRSYADKGEAFADYARLLSSSPRYQQALNTGSDARAFAQALARGGYATDPAYADKLVQVARQVKASGALSPQARQSRD